MMSSEQRREWILKYLKDESEPVSASLLAGKAKVSRQVIVGDIALLRAQGHDILATARGYVMAAVVSRGRFTGKIACQHSLEGAQQELLTIVQGGGEVLDVVVEHELYGEITGRLNISTAADVAAFMKEVRGSETRLLSELTGGVHLHTVACPDRETFDAIRRALRDAGVLYGG